jgi:hypothetical protein
MFGVINSDPVLKMNWEYGIFLCNNTLEGKNGKDVFDLINAAINNPPMFSNSGLVGFPINAIFSELMQNQNGRVVFSNKIVN